MYYTDQRNDNHLLGKTVLVILGVIIGASIGLYVAARTLPMPPQTQYYYIGGSK